MPHPAIRAARVDGRTVVITGATGGIGLAAAAELTRLGADVVITGRSRERGEAAVSRIAELGGRAPRLLLADLERPDEVRTLAAQILATCPQLHVLVHNAGALHGRPERTPDGIDRTLALNVVAPALLTHLLEGRLRESAPARAVFVASSAHRGGRLDPERLRRTRSLAPSLPFLAGARTYAASKLADVLLAQAFADRWAGSGMVAVSLHPGVVNTGFSAGEPGLFALAFRLGRPLMRTPSQGADTVVACATADAGTLQPGAWYADRRPRRTAPGARDPRRAAALLDAALEIGGVSRATAAG